MPTNWNRKMVTSDGAISLNDTEKNVRNSPAPSRRADSRSLLGDGGGGEDPGEVDAERADDARQEHREVGVDDPGRREQQEQRERERGGGHQDAAEDDGEQELPAPERNLASA